MNRRNVGLLGMMLGIGLSASAKSAFGDTGILVPQVRMLDKKKGGGNKGRRTGGCLCRDPMPLTIIEKDLLAGFPPGRLKKAFVRQLKIKYGKV